MSMILALPIEGKPLCIDTSCEDWRGKMFDLIGKAPDEIINKRGEKLRVSAGATFTWISQNFKTCPEGASRDVIKLYAPGSASLVGRPRVLDYKNYNDHGNPLRRPTWAYQWDIVSEFSGDPIAAYQTYTNEFDNLTPEQVEWEPYGPRSALGNASTFTLNPACMAEAHLWYMHCPLVCMWAVEHHMPQRVMRQFGLLQPCPPEWKDTSIVLHGRRSKKTDWHNIHKKHVKKFVMRVEEQKKAKGIQYEEHSEDAFNQYLRWFLDNTRVQILPDAYGHEILEEPLIFDDIATLKYNKLVREGRQTSFAPMLNFVRTEIQKQAVEHETALESFPHGEKGESSFREFVKRQGQKLRRLSNLLGCRDPEIMTPSQSRSASPSDQDDANNSNSTARDEEVSDEAGSEHEVDEDDEDVPLGKYVKKKGPRTS
ncbi:uncharacterized protein LOC124650596 [Lolium rigidum]|uniref:uncharacterized protein LOC124650596 n=1 Tax=Lolium rigidum TaxID=89674 RepID=UPI001F5D4A28|nr:uncharacterized protein LOC124650596 [Lolium rigidum]